MPGKLKSTKSNSTSSSSINTTTGGSSTRSSSNTNQIRETLVGIQDHWEKQQNELTSKWFKFYGRIVMLVFVEYYILKKTLGGILFPSDNPEDFFITPTLKEAISRNYPQILFVLAQGILILGIVIYGHIKLWDFKSSSDANRLESLSKLSDNLGRDHDDPFVQAVRARLDSAIREAKRESILIGIEWSNFGFRLAKLLLAAVFITFFILKRFNDVEGYMRRMWIVGFAGALICVGFFAAVSASKIARSRRISEDNLKMRITALSIRT